MTVTILHNPRCSKSRATLALLQERGIEPEVLLYLEQPPGTSELRSIIQLLGVDVRSIIRKGEAEYRDLGLDNDNLDDDQLIQAMTSHPRLIERPIVITNGKAAIGRPPEAVLDIL